MLELLRGLVHELYLLGAHHVYATRAAQDGYVVTRHYLVVACRIPAGHGVFRCSGWVRR